ncbi:hypothetical protein [Xenorhabdus ishibashii]|uniref:Amino acid--ligase 2 n=1 Tax=Xenorhabdus ishibashii TaxID=1034471 RepID=A0A2D0KE38_9GAMM|nr:hypothetical protein [Xenorhabdus ishibashii]PHM61678.1 Amino acid-- ligase 2 [Xenorhabdus ishibashii]
MINTLIDRNWLSLNGSSERLIGYRFHGELYETYQLLDKMLISLAGMEGVLIPHSCNTLLPTEVLDRIGFFDKLPANPMFALPHIPPTQPGSKLVLSPSTCYHTFAALENKIHQNAPTLYTAKGECHRFEPDVNALGRLVNFTMREFILIGPPTDVIHFCDRIFERILRFLNYIDDNFRQETANDVFYGENSVVTQKIQRALGVKKEVITSCHIGNALSVGSRNYHRNLFTEKFNIHTHSPNEELHSSCVAFGMERLLLSLISKIPEFNNTLLYERINEASLCVEEERA